MRTIRPADARGPATNADGVGRERAGRGGFFLRIRGPGARRLSDSVRVFFRLGAVPVWTGGGGCGIIGLYTNVWEGDDIRMRRYDSQDARRRVLAACARLFLERGYTNTRMADILREADVSASSFQNIFRTKDGVLTAFVEIMFSGQFDMARELTAGAPTPAHVYAVETALQLALTELNGNLRDIYVEAYTCPEALALIHRRTAEELQAAFGAYLPEATAADFAEIEVGTAGMMRAYMACRCTADFPLERKIRRFLEMSLSVFHVPEEERARIVAHVAALDVRALAKAVVNTLFESLSMEFEL